ncbi:MAG TPA: hypothetical protein VL287_15625 [Gemmatimonadales bacterium]|jgi:hypothetical protein|nr:hypothetical protein [Gemmatimonadales bacterium]
MKSPKQLVSEAAQKVTDVAARVLGARTAVTQLRDADMALREAHAAAEGERGRLLSAELPKAELLKVAEQELAQLAAAWLAARGPAVVSSLAGALEETPSGELRVVRYTSLVDEFGLWLPALAALALDPIRDGVARVVRAAAIDEAPP